MKNKKYVRLVLIVVLCLAIILPCIPFKTEATVDNFAAAGTGFKGKKLSILGDSISTYLGISNNTAYNTTIGNNAVYYNETNHKLLDSVTDTWWMQAIDKLGMSLCVNNSWSGSCVSDREGSDASIAYRSRCTQLHNNTGSTAVNPDIIAIYMGTNDIKGITSQAMLKNKGGSAYPMGATMNADGTASVTFNFSTVTGKVNTSSYVPGSILEAYALMVYRTLNKYQNAEVYCFTIQPTDSQNQYNRQMHALYNAGIRAIVKHFHDSGKKIYLVDVCENAGITQDLTLLNLFLAETHHPNALGMDAITNCFLSSLVANSRFSAVKFGNKVTYELCDAYVTAGQITSAATGEKFSVSLLPTHSQFDLDVTVTMNGEDITANSYNGGTVLIKNVTGPIHIKAEAVYETGNYRWEGSNGVLKSCVPDGKDYHVSGQLQTKELVHKEIYNNNGLLGIQYNLQEPVVLRNEEPWVLEWKASGSWYNTMIFTQNNNDASRNNSYLFFSNSGTNPSFIGIGFRKGYNNNATEYPAGYTNFGVSTAELTLSDSVTHTYRLVNKVSDGSNMIYLSVDGTEIGPMNNYYSGVTDKKSVDNWVSGRDFVFYLMGSDSRPLRECDIEYVQVWEGGGFDTQRLTQLQQEFLELQPSVSGYNGYAAYQAAVRASENFIGTQEQCDAHVDAIIAARNAMTTACDAYTASGEILNVELITGDYVRIGKQVGMRITTAPDVAQISVGSEEFVNSSAQLQTVTRVIDGTKYDTLVKVWFITFDSGITDTQTITYTVKTYLANASTEAASLDKLVSFQ